MDEDKGTQLEEARQVASLINQPGWLIWREIFNRRLQFYTTIDHINNEVELQVAKALIDIMRQSENELAEIVEEANAGLDKTD